MKFSSILGISAILAVASLAVSLPSTPKAPPPESVAQVSLIPDAELSFQPMAVFFVASDDAPSYDFVYEILHSCDQAGDLIEAQVINSQPAISACLDCHSVQTAVHRVDESQRSLAPPFLANR